MPSLTLVPVEIIGFVDLLLKLAWIPVASRYFGIAIVVIQPYLMILVHDFTLARIYGAFVKVKQSLPIVALVFEKLVQIVLVEKILQGCTFCSKGSLSHEQACVLVYGPEPVKRLL